MQNLKRLLTRTSEIADILDLCDERFDIDIIDNLDAELDHLEIEFYRLMNEGESMNFTLTRDGPNYMICLEERQMCPIYAATEYAAMEGAVAWLSSFIGNHSVSWDVEPEYTHHD